MHPDSQEIRYLTLCYKSELGKVIVLQHMPKVIMLEHMPKVIVLQHMPKHYYQIKFGAGSALSHPTITALKSTNVIVTGRKN